MKLTHEDYMALERAIGTLIDIGERQRKEGVVSDEARDFIREGERIVSAIIDFQMKYQGDESKHLVLKARVRAMMNAAVHSEEAKARISASLAQYPNIVQEIEAEEAS